MMSPLRHMAVAVVDNAMVVIPEPERALRERSLPSECHCCGEFARFLRLRYGGKSQAFGPLLCQLPVGCRLFSKRLFKRRIVCLAGHSLKLKRVFQIFANHLHDTGPGLIATASYYETTIPRINSP